MREHREKSNQVTNLGVRLTQWSKWLWTRDLASFRTPVWLSGTPGSLPLE